MKNIIKLVDVIAQEEEREEADKLSEAFSNDEERGSDQECDDWNLTPAEELSLRISTDLADMTAARFSEMVEGMEIDYIESIVRRLNHTNHKTAVRMIQGMFLIKGYEDAALSLDFLMACQEHVDEIYDWFIEDLFETRFFEWFLTEACIKDSYASNCLSACLS